MMTWTVACMLLWLTMEYVTKRTSILLVILTAMTVPIVILVLVLFTIGHVAVAQNSVQLDMGIVVMILNVQMDLSVEDIIVDLALHGILVVVRSKTLV